MMLAQAPAEGRLSSLDALRGVAAFLVLTFHGWKLDLRPELTGWQWQLLNYTPLNLFISGRPWVMLFFVLSGFVLALSLERASRIDYGGFVVRRLCRVYLPFVASLMFSVLLYELIQPDHIWQLSLWFNELAWSHQPSALMLGQHLLMTGVAGEDTLNPVMWSLVYELRISLLFPLLFLAAYRWPRVTLVAALVASLACAWLAGCRTVACQPFRGANVAESLWLTGYFSVFFVVGILLARWRQGVRDRIRRLSSSGGWLLALAAIYAMILPNMPRLAAYVPADAMYLAGSAAMVALAVAGGRWNQALDSRPFAWLGKVSYSLYLTHNIVLLAVVHLLFGRVGGSTLLLVVLVASLFAAAIAQRCVETPAIQLAARISAARRLRRADTVA
jgi:peptidoglycan/LPS O-acetylase OafA/YrhL